MVACLQGAMLLTYSKSKSIKKPAGYHLRVFLLQNLKFEYPEEFMNHTKTGIGNRVIYNTFTYRIMLPYGKSILKESFFVLLNYERKMLINTAVIEHQHNMETILRMNSVDYKDLDYVINITSFPEDIGLNSIIQFKNRRIKFFSHPDKIKFIEDTVYQHEMRYIPGFYRLVSGNTQGIEALQDGQTFDLGEERATIHFLENTHIGKFFIQLNRSGIKIFADGLKDSGTYIRKKRALTIL